MRGALIHGVLLAIMLVYGYRTWTRDKTVKPNIGNVVLWDKSEADLVALEWKAENKIVRIERRDNAYWWGTETTITKKVKPPTPPTPPVDQGSGAGSGSAAGSAAGSGSAAEPPKPIEEEERKTREFPLGDNGEKTVKNYLGARALRDLGKPTDQAKKDYKLDEAKITLTVELKDGKRTFLVGGNVYGGADRYVMDQASGIAYVLARDMIKDIEVGMSSLQLTDARGFDVNKIATVTIEADGKNKTAARVTAGEEGKQVKTWGDPQTKKANQTLANFIDNAGNLRPTEYNTTLKPTGAPLVTLTYKDERGATLGTLSLYKHEKPAKLPEGTELDPANPPKGETEYFIITPRTRVAAIVRKDVGERTEQDIPTAFSDKPVDSVDPKGNPFRNPPPGAVPAGPPAGGHGMPHGGPHGHGGPGEDPHGGAPGMAPGGAPAPTPGSAAAPAAPAPGGAAAPASGAAKPAAVAPAKAAPAKVAPAPAAPPAAAPPAAEPVPAP
jgi:hypothetical protein